MPASMRDMTTIRATEVSAPPAWALLQRQLISLMEEAAPMMAEQYAEKGGVLYYKDDLDDLYERFYNWGLFYSIGADRTMLDLALREWNAITRSRDDRVADYDRPDFRPQVHNEYYNLLQPDDWQPANRLCSEWHHMSEGNMHFYDLGVADPTISENVRRARRFAAMYIGEDPEAPNWDPVHKILRAPMQSSQGPYLKANLIHVQQWLHGSHAGYGRPFKPMGTRATLYPVIKDLELDWMEDPKRAEEVVDTFNDVVLNGDTANNLASTALVTNAYLYTGDEKYKRWVLDYVEVWMERIKQNNGIIPDNVGPTGKIGEQRQGQWWGGLYGWSHYQGFNIIFHGLTIAAECALMLTGDYGYLDLLRSQVKILLDNAITRDDGQMLVPTRYGKNGWHEPAPTPFQFTGPQPMRLLEPAHLYHASMSQEDYDLIAQVRDGDVERDWSEVPNTGEKNNGQNELGRFQFYDGKNPDWPERALRADYEQALEAYRRLRDEPLDASVAINENKHPENPVFTKGLTQVTMGTPQSVYNGGLLRATVRYFDGDRRRPGLPEDVAALVDELKDDLVGMQLVNLSRTQTRSVIVHAGAFGEHTFTHASSESDDGAQRVPVDAKHFAVELPPSTSIRVSAGLKRFANTPSYTFPWHGDKIPVPFQ